MLWKCGGKLPKNSDNKNLKNTIIFLIVAYNMKFPLLDINYY